MKVDETMSNNYSLQFVSMRPIRFTLTLDTHIIKHRHKRVKKAFMKASCEYTEWYLGFKISTSKMIINQKKLKV